MTRINKSNFRNFDDHNLGHVLRGRTFEYTSYDYKWIGEIEDLKAYLDLP